MAKQQGAKQQGAKQQGTKQQGLVQKQKFSIYTMMLIGAFLALVLACVLQFLELERYGHDITAEEYRRAGVHLAVPSSTFLG